MKMLFLILSMLAMLAFTAGTASALSLDAGGNATDGVSTVNFTIVGDQLIITLTNNGTATVPADVLTALFFSITGDPALNKVSALLGSGSGFLDITKDTATFSIPGSNNVGAKWAYSNNVGDAANAYGVPVNEGIGSTGLGIFGAPDFKGDNISDPAGVDGTNFGIVGGVAKNGKWFNGDFANNDPLIQNKVVFTLDGFEGSLSDIGNIVFQYGTSLPTNVPEPGALLLLGSGLIAIGLYRRRRK